MIPFLLANIIALVMFLVTAVALYPDGDDDQKKNDIPALSIVLKNILVPYPPARQQPELVPLSPLALPQRRPARQRPVQEEEDTL